MLTGELEYRFRIHTFHALISCLLVLCSSLVIAQSAPTKADEGGTALHGSTNVHDNVNIQAVLLPRKQAERVFSKEIGSHYAVVQVTVDNKSADAAFVLHSIFIDYAGWALSGLTFNATATGGTSSSGDICPQGQYNYKATAYQSISCEGQVASVESRVIRGELQDASNWTWRNGVIRAAMLVGAVASGIPSFSSKNAVKYVGAYNGQLVPGMEVFWPDGMVGQMNRASDFGFQTNKIIAKDTSDIVYAFFPLDRFLTSGMKRIFLNAPAVFFAPAQIFADKHMGKMQSQVDEMKDLIEDLTGSICTAADNNIARCPPAKSKESEDKNAKKYNQDERDKKMLQLLAMDCSAVKPGDANAADCKVAKAAQELLVKVSLNSMNVLVQGVMTVDVATVPATITDITFDEGNDSPKVWTVTGTDLAGTITGRYLTGGVPNITSIEVPNAPSAKIADYIDPKTISVVSDGSSDSKLNFKLQLKKAIPSESKLHFQVTKYDTKDSKKTSGVNSMDFVLPVNYVSTPAAQGSAGKPDAANNAGKPTPTDKNTKP
jgi:hypothetical protein